MVSVQNPAAAASAFWSTTATHGHVFAAQRVGSLVPHWHQHFPSSCVSVSSHALGVHHHHPTPGGTGDALGTLGQALVSSAAAFLPPQLAPLPPTAAAICPASISQQVLLSPPSFAGGTVLSLSVAQRQPPISMVDPEQPIGYGSFGVVWYVQRCNMSQIKETFSYHRKLCVCYVGLDLSSGPPFLPISLAHVPVYTDTMGSGPQCSTLTPAEPTSVVVW